MLIGLRRGLLTVAFIAGVAAPSHAEPIIPAAEVRAAMGRVEGALAGMGIDVSGYALSTLPTAELAPSDHPFLQGNDGGYADGRVYINERSIAGCRDLTLMHELVHDATVKHRLFAAVANEEVRKVVEALADAVTAAAANEPYRPGCLPDRAFALSSAELSRLARAQP